MHRQVKGYFELAQDYHISATLLMTQMPEAPYLYNPICYILRHTLELLLKGLIVQELRKGNKHLVLKDIKVDNNRQMNKTHSIKILWDYYKQLASFHNTNDRRFIDKVLTKADKKDFDSSKYRYPIDRNDKPLNLQPIDIRFDDISTDLAKGIPYVIRHGGKTGTITKGQRLLQDMRDLFDVAELLFEFLENPK